MSVSKKITVAIAVFAFGISLTTALAAQPPTGNACPKNAFVNDFAGVLPDHLRDTIEIELALYAAQPQNPRIILVIATDDAMRHGNCGDKLLLNLQTNAGRRGPEAALFILLGAGKGKVEIGATNALIPKIDKSELGDAIRSALKDNDPPGIARTGLSALMRILEGKGRTVPPPSTPAILPTPNRAVL